MIEDFQGIDVDKTLLESRKIFIMQDIDADIVAVTIAKILVLDAMDPESPIEMFINSPGGDVNAGLALYDVMTMISCPVYTFCIGQCCSMAAVLLAAGDKRFSFPNARIMIHQPSGGTSGTTEEIDIYSKEITRYKQQLAKILSKHTKQAYKKVFADTNKDYYMSPREAQKYGIVDKILRGNKPCVEKS